LEEAQKGHWHKKIAFDPSKLSLIEYGAICKLLEKPSYAKIYLGKLTFYSSGISIATENLPSSSIRPNFKITILNIHWRMSWNFISISTSYTYRFGLGNQPIEAKFNSSNISFV
jgi:hypothetical protein